MAGDEVDRLLCRYMYDVIFVNGDGDGMSKSGSWVKTVAVQVTVRLNSPTCRRVQTRRCSYRRDTSLICLGWDVCPPLGTSS